ncbi:DUF1549 domain-containing protein [Bremerella sp. JC817]|uniref:DUF1549 domain-containing protein n=1 Tax=Bremerella sp. JC817 TaxID=3231756 RepID=UPI00345B0AFE
MRLRTRRHRTYLSSVVLLLIAPTLLCAADAIDTKQLPGILLDNTAAELMGPWQPSIHTKPYIGDGYIHSGVPGRDEASVPKSLTFRHKLPKSGKYGVYLAYNANSNRAAAAPIEIHHAGGDASLTLNQRETPKGPALFQSLGQFDFNADEDAVIAISDKDAKGIVIVDAVLFVPQNEIAKLDAVAKKLAEAKPEPKQKPTKKEAAEEKVAQVAPPFARHPRTDVQLLTPESLDQLIAEEAHITEATDLIDDETFLRRVTIDVIGRIPTEQERSDFLADTNPAKRALMIDRLLDSPEFGGNWATYWSDVFSYRIPQPELTYLDYQVFQDWLAQQLNEGTGWDEVTYRILTATGKVGDNPPAFFVGFHQASTSRLAGETTRIFLGTQIQCAECHDHPFVDIPQERFHQMAAFFVRTNAKLPWNDSSQIEVGSKEKGEHKMPDTNQAMMPAVFSGDAMSEGASDLDRRVLLANWVIQPDNALFAKAYANRIWERLMDQPFCDPVDEISEEAGFPSLPSVHDAVAAHFIASEYDAKPLMRVILNTKAYQRQLDAKDELAGQLTSAELRKMRGDVVFNSLVTAVELPNVEGTPMKPTAEMRFPPPPKSTQDLVNEVFGYDPSLGRAFRPQTMQQAMFLMNNRQLQNQVKAGDDQQTKLARMLKETPDDRQAIQRLYVNVLGRAPQEKELEIAYDYVQEVESRGEAFEDLLWALLNTAEFTTRN